MTSGVRGEEGSAKSDFTPEGALTNTSTNKTYDEEGQKSSDVIYGRPLTGIKSCLSRERE